MCAERRLRSGCRAFALSYFSLHRVLHLVTKGPNFLHADSHSVWFTHFAAQVIKMYNVKFPWSQNRKKMLIGSALVICMSRPLWSGDTGDIAGLQCRDLLTMCPRSVVNVPGF